MGNVQLIVSHLHHRLGPDFHLPVKSVNYITKIKDKAFVLFLYESGNNQQKKN